MATWDKFTAQAQAHGHKKYGTISTSNTIKNHFKKRSMPTIHVRNNDGTYSVTNMLDYNSFTKENELSDYIRDTTQKLNKQNREMDPNNYLQKRKELRNSSMHDTKPMEYYYMQEMKENEDEMPQNVFQLNDTKFDVQIENRLQNTNLSNTNANSQNINSQNTDLSNTNSQNTNSRVLQKTKALPKMNNENEKVRKQNIETSDKKQKKSKNVLKNIKNRIIQNRSQDEDDDDCYDPWALRLVAFILCLCILSLFVWAIISKTQNDKKDKLENIVRNFSNTGNLIIPEAHPKYMNE